ncbi:hypothetical protein [Streptomyces sp. TRM70350]|uniref:hypothetical protein n=1 Tax=Streptomyces sp. TRM70350 TaxID=2856165 RepID=UPI001C46FFAF|nr:hypothetical protein [Streptomyces sp. TRM70350]MBV7696075.1 hypothetical protein [Streptomyces sp. TRM70350]
MDRLHVGLELKRSRIVSVGMVGLSVDRPNSPRWKASWSQVADPGGAVESLLLVAFGIQ